MNELLINNVLGSFSPDIREIIKEVLIDVDFGLSAQNLKINPNSIKTLHNDYMEKYVDSFILEIPYAGKRLEWEIIFKDEDYTYAPDFEFINDIFLIDPDVNVITDHIPSLANWSITDNKSLKSVIHELLVLYKEYQIMRLQTENAYTRFFNEYQDLITNVDVSKSNVELYIDNGGAVHYLVGLLVDFSCLPPYIHPPLIDNGDKILNPHQDLAILKVSFIKPDCSKVQCSLQLSPRLEQTIGNEVKLHIPHYSKDTTLVTYVKDITKLLNDRIEQISNNHKMRTEFITTLVAQCGSSIIEYDNLLFSKATLLFNINKIHVLVSICLGDKFPQEKPKVILYSIYNLKNDKPFCQPLDSYRYNPRSKPEDTIKRLLLDLQEQIPKFQAISQQHFNI